MSVRLKPTQKIIQSLGLQENGPAHAFFTQRCKDYMEKYVPMRDNILRQVVNLQVNRITYEMKYARYQFYGMREDGTHKISHWTTPGTGPRWDLKMVTAEMPKIVKEVNNFVKKKGNK